MKQYIDGLIEIIKEGRRVEDRTGTGTISHFGDVQSVYYMKDGFPNMTLKSTWFKGIKEELMWFMNNVPDEYKKFGNTNIKYLVDRGVGIWNEWPHQKFLEHEDTYNNSVQPFTPTSLEDFVKKIKSDDQFAMKWGDLGPVYGKQWVNWFKNSKISINQIQAAIHQLETYPDDRGNIVSAWNVSDLKDMALRPCHTMFQMKSEPLTKKERYDVFVLHAADQRLHEWKHREIGEVTEAEMDSFDIPKRRLSLKMYQRSADYFLGVPFNISSYALLLHMIAKVTNHVPHKFIHTFGDAHIYSNHYDQVNKLLNRTRGKDEEPIDFFLVDNPEKYVGDNMGPKLPELILPDVKDIWDFRSEDIKLNGYKDLGGIKAPVAV